MLPLVDKTENPVKYLGDLFFSGSAGGAIIVDKGEPKHLAAGAINAKGLLIVTHGSAAVLEKAGIPNRVCKRGRHFRQPFEAVRMGLDLTIQCREKSATLFTKDGIPLEALIRVYFRIDSGGQHPSMEDMYPVIDDALIKAVYTIADWREHTIESAIEICTAIVASKYAYQIFDPSEKLAQAGIRTDLRHLQDELVQRLGATSADWGVEVCSTSIALKPPVELTQHSTAMASGPDDIRQIKEFIDDTGGTAGDFALLQLARAIAKTGVIPPSAEKILNRATVQKQ
jgi:SPFH domain/Band 7 family protein